MSQTLRPETQLQPIRLEVYSLDQQLHDAGLLGGEQLVPQWVQVLQRFADRRLRHLLPSPPATWL
jgi:hypothetical protein